MYDHEFDNDDEPETPAPITVELIEESEEERCYYRFDRDENIQLFAKMLELKYDNHKPGDMVVEALGVPRLPPRGQPRTVGVPPTVYPATPKTLGVVPHRFVCFGTD